MHHFPVLVAQHLKLDVTGVFEKFLRVNVRRTKGLLRLAARRLVSGEKLILFAYHAHAASASTCGGLENQRIADPSRVFRELLFPVDNALASRTRWPPCGHPLPPRAASCSHH